MSLSTVAGLNTEIARVDAAIEARSPIIAEYGMFGSNGKRTVYRTLKEMLDYRGELIAMRDGLSATTGVGNRRTYMRPKSFGSW